MNVLKWIILSLAFSAVWIGCSRTIPIERTDYEMLSEAELNEIIETGLEAWRMPGAIAGGAACVQCHSPDGIDLAKANYSNFTVRRRGAGHAAPGIETLNASKLEDIVNKIRALQVKHGFTAVDPQEWIPFQPGELPIEGKSNQERDAEFGRFLKDMGLILSMDWFNKEADTQQQAERLTEVNLLDLPVGIRLNLWSEDPYYSSSADILGDWLPLNPIRPTGSGQYLFDELQRAYTANTGIKQLSELLSFISEVDFRTPAGTLDFLSYSKYKAQLIAQHSFRYTGKKSEQRSSSIDEILSDLNRAEPEIGNPFWDIGRYFADSPTIDELNLPESHLSRLSGDTFQDLALAWLWLGWMADPGFQFTNCEPEWDCVAILSDQLTEHELHFHRMFMKSKAAVERRYQ
ncbi:MAG: hypothetical protein EA391_03585 [Balneolaceae bacterium]|nr:MAG: hypothetical protein EA391_03585 [Balneolaceae bacterium]